MMAKLGDLVGDVPPGGRLTLTSGTPVTTSDVTAATSIYYAPYVGNKIALYDTSEWLFYEFTERTLSIAGYTANTNYDIFLYDNSGTLTLESVAWTNDTTRATAIVMQDGVYTKSGDATRRYLGTIRTTSTTGQCEDSETKRYCWNYYNRAERLFKVVESTGNWTYNSSTWRALNNSASNRIELVVGVQDSLLRLVAEVTAKVDTAPGYGKVAISRDDVGTTIVSDRSNRHGSSNTNEWGSLIAGVEEYTSIGYHYYQVIEGVGAGQIEFYANNDGWRTGLTGYIDG